MGSADSRLNLIVGFCGIGDHTSVFVKTDKFLTLFQMSRGVAQVTNSLFTYSTQLTYHIWRYYWTETGVRMEVDMETLGTESVPAWLQVQQD